MRLGWIRRTVAMTFSCARLSRFITKASVNCGAGCRKQRLRKAATRFTKGITKVGSAQHARLIKLKTITLNAQAKASPQGVGLTKRNSTVFLQRGISFY